MCLEGLSCRVCAMKACSVWGSVRFVGCQRLVVCGCLRLEGYVDGLRLVDVYVCMFGSERKERDLAHECIGDNLMVELAPFYFKLPAGGENFMVQRMATRLA